MGLGNNPTCRECGTEEETSVYILCECQVLMRGVHRILVRKPEGTRPLGRPRRRWEDNIKMELQEVEGGFRKRKVFNIKCVF
jgi:hypothetical protein